MALSSKHKLSMMRRFNSSDWVPLDTSELYVEQLSTELILLETGTKTKHGNVFSQGGEVSQQTCEVCRYELQGKKIPRLSREKMN